MSKYDYSSNVIPVFIEKSETELQAFPTQWSAQAANSNGYKIVFLSRINISGRFFQLRV